MGETDSDAVSQPPIGLVATDLDGTIVRADGTVSARVVAALGAVLDRGVPWVFVTGRPPRWMHDVAQATAHHGIAICANGALVYDLHDEVVLERFEIATELALETVRRLRAVMPAAVFAVEHGQGFRHESAYLPRWERADLVVTDTVEELLVEPVAKLLVRDETSTGDAMLALAQASVGELVTVTHSNPVDCLLEISAPGVTKATTLARLAAGHGVDAGGVLAFGDQPNDLAMLRWAGTAYAMRGGHPDVLAAVESHAESVEEDGVARIVERYLADGTIRSPDAGDRGPRSA
jgi:Cof subfamily protein (haloacid dehalogenase superfamily)